MAWSMLEQGWYQPQYSSDIWALGLLMLEAVGGVIPGQHWDLQNTPAYLEECEGPTPTQQPAHRKHLQYLSNLLTTAGGHYADQVRCLRLLNKGSA